MKTIEEKRTLPIKKDYDVVVAGGGVAGIAAALASARNGADTLLIEREYILGGLATAGIVTIYLPLCDGCGTQLSYGIAEELLKLSVRHFAEERRPDAWFDGGTKEEKAAQRYQVQFNPHMFALDAEKLLKENGVTLLFGTVVADTHMMNGKIDALVVENKSGRYGIGVNTCVIDCTGDADIAKFSGEKTALFGQGNILAAWHYYVGKNGYHLRQLGACDVPDKEKDGKKEPKPLIDRRFSGIDGEELSEQTELSHARILADVLECRTLDDTHIPVTIPTIPQIRMTRRVDGVIVMDDTDSFKDYPDSVGLFGDWRKDGPAYALPFAALHGTNVKNLLFAGRNISVTDAMWDITRVIPVCAVSGEAAGTAAAMGDDVTELNMTELQNKLRAAGVKLTFAEVGLAAKE